MKHYLKERLEELRNELEGYEEIANNTKDAQEYKGACQWVAYYTGAIEELEALIEEFDLL